MKKEMNKKGAEMTIGTILVIVMGLVVVALVIWGFSVGWNNLYDRIVNFGGGGDNVQTIVQSCQVACSTNNVYGWCTLNNTVKSKDVSLKGGFTCQALSGKSAAGLSDCSGIPSCS